jgi:hypothetical protein
MHHGLVQKTLTIFTRLFLPVDEGRVREATLRGIMFKISKGGGHTDLHSLLLSRCRYRTAKSKNQ